MEWMQLEEEQVLRPRYRGWGRILLPPEQEGHELLRSCRRRPPQWYPGQHEYRLLDILRRRQEQVPLGACVRAGAELGANPCADRGAERGANPCADRGADR